jgi:hypothetical protein
MALRHALPRVNVSKRRKLSDTGRNRMETTSRMPTRKNTTIIITFRKPVVCPFGAKMCPRIPYAIRLVPTQSSMRRTPWPSQGHVQIRVGAAEPGRNS